MFCLFKLCSVFFPNHKTQQPRLFGQSIFLFVVSYCSHARNQGSPGERQRFAGGAPGGNRETELQLEPCPDQYQPHPQWPGLSRWGVGRHYCTAMSQHPPVAIAAADQCQLHTGTKQKTFNTENRYSKRTVWGQLISTKWLGHLKKVLLPYQIYRKLSKLFSSNFACFEKLNNIL